MGEPGGWLEGVGLVSQWLAGVGDLLHAVLPGVDEGEDVVVGAFENTLQDCQIRYDTAGVEVLGTIEDDVVAVGCDFEIAVAWVDGSSNELEWKWSDKITYGLGTMELTKFCSMSTF